MSQNAAFQRAWCVLAGGVVLLSIIPGRGGTYEAFSSMDSNRWVHFLMYLAIATIPVGRWSWRTALLFAAAFAALGFGGEYLRALVPDLVGRPQNALADLFGVAAGILLGLNIRMLTITKSTTNGPAVVEQDTIRWRQEADASRVEIGGPRVDYDQSAA
jgi:hypothetical protein